MARIGFDATRLLNNFTGFGNYGRNLVSDLVNHYPKNEILLFSQEVTQSDETANIVGLPMVGVCSPPKWRRYFWRSFGMRLDLYQARLDLFHGLAHEIPRAAYSTRIPKVVTVCDVIYKHFPESYSNSVIEAKDAALKNACSRADHIVAISESTKSDLIQFFNINPDHISVVYPSASQNFQESVSTHDLALVKDRYALPTRYLLYVGSITERKNLLGACKALFHIPESDRIPLVVIGKHSGYVQKVYQYLQANNLSRWVYFREVESNSDLALIYKGADLFIYPSLYEGFGMPILEALMSGVPVVTSNTSSMPEVAGPQSTLVDPTNSEEIAHAITQLQDVTSQRDHIIELGHAHSTQFANSEVAKSLANVYKHLGVTV